MRLPAILLALACANPAFAAGLTVNFQDGAPKDRFTLRYDGTCALGAEQVVIDLGTAPAGLIFDITASGAGVDVFQPLEWVQGTAETSAVTDGDTSLTIGLEGLAPGDVLAFTVDIDDTTSTRQITVNGSEMVGATVTFAGATGTFAATGTAQVPLAPCPS